MKGKWVFRMVSLLLAMTLLVPAMVSAHTVSTKGPTSDLRSALGQILGEHALLAITAMQKGYDGAADFGQAAGELNRNTDDLTAAVASVYGMDAGEAFKEIWSSHIGYFVDYVKATAAKDAAGQQAAIADLEQYRTDQAAFFAGANPNFDETVIASELKMHIDHLLGTFDHYVAGDYEEAYEEAYTAYSHMFMTADALAGGIAAQFPDAFTDREGTNPAFDLRSALEQKLGEHALLAVLAMQKGIDGKADFAAAATSLNRNTEELSAAVGSIYGVEAGEAFEEIWSSHIGYFVDYVTATAGGDQKSKEQALADLEEYRMEQAKFFAGANPEFNEAAVASELKMHISHLVDAFDQYVAKDYDDAYKSIRAAYAHMFPTGAYLAEGISKQFPDLFHTAPAKNVMKVWFQIGSSTLFIDDKKTVMDTEPFVNDGSSYIPLRYLAESIGAKVTWDSASRSVWIETGSNKAEFWIGQNFMELDGKRMVIGQPVIIKDGRTQVPVRFIAELFGWDVAWGANDWSITLTKQLETEEKHDMHGEY
ncbi:copper amine oxidase N-terminal domain-containing protein [Paenibacillus sp. sgz302251]|uniref:copper amine oxidase N-terminal domain-containing protein n=1 Tax=Paenibacillus sp. sgz302251 TaxID=3414493 RepID=UPI003C7A26D1